MKYYVEYYTKKEDGSFFHPCGDRSIVQLDARNKLETMHNDAKLFNGNRRPVYDAYLILCGERLLNAVPITGLRLL